MSPLLENFSLSFFFFFFFKILFIVLAGVAQWIEHRPANQRVASSIPSQGTRLGSWQGPQVGEHKKQPHIDVSLPLFLLPFSIKNKLLKKKDFIFYF